MVTCPYCRYENNDDTDRCLGCHAAFPWSRDVTLLKDQLGKLTKDQDRIARALRQAGSTSHVSDESAQPTDAHGSLFTRIRRLAIIILGSVGGTLLLGVQTYILHQQTDLIAKQTEALSLDQSSHIRDRIVACTRFRRHRVRCFNGTGGASWSGGSLRGSSSLRPYG